MSLSDNSESRRVVGTFSGAAIVISSMVGTGIFTTTGFMIEMGARGGDIILAWLIGGLVALCGALCYGELGANMPESGGEYYYISRVLHPALGFLSGWVSLIVGFSAPIAAAAMAMHIYMAEIVSAWPVRLMAVLTIAVLSLLHSYNLRLGVRVQVGLVILKLLLIISFIGGMLGAASASGNIALLEISPEFWTTSSFAVILIFVAFAYSGWNAATYIGAEIKNPAVNLPRALISGTMIVTALYMLVNFAFISSVSLDRLAGVESVASTVGTALWGTVGGRVVSLLIALGLISTVSSMIIVGPRVYEAMARDTLFPAALARLNKHGVPSAAVFFQAVTASVIALTASFGALLIYIGFTLNIFAALTVFAVVISRRQNKELNKSCLGYPVPPIIFLAFTIWMTIWSIQSRPLSALAGLATLAVGYVIYRLQLRRKELSSTS